jgi:uncharacterized protein
MLGLSARCNLGCTYCFAAPRDPRGGRQRGRGVGRTPLLDERTVLAAARLVARHCAQRGLPLTLVFQGGGEPTLHWELLRRLHQGVAAVAGQRGVALFSYVATNGVLPESRARWLGRHFDLVGLSIDGPPDVHDALRPSRRGAPTSRRVETTARALAGVGAAFQVRTTITPATVRRQAEIVAYCRDVIGARVMRFEPVYGANHSRWPPFRPHDADEFVAAFVDARAVAAASGCSLSLSGVRPGEVHGPHCGPLRDALQLAPDGSAVACFLATGQRPPDARLVLGRYDPRADEFVIDQDRADALRRRAARVPARCDGCAIAQHCARECPDGCALVHDADGAGQDGFRCRVQRLLARHLVAETGPGI